MTSTAAYTTSGADRGRTQPAPSQLNVPPETQAAILKAIPSLRAFAISLSGNLDQADDLVQEAIVRGLSNIGRFQTGTNMEAWLITILRNQFHTGFRKTRREVADPDGVMAGMLSTPPEQVGHLDFADLKSALVQLPMEQREALLLVSAEGLSYEEVAEICGTRIGTVKSRIFRARNKLGELLSVEGVEDIGADRMFKAALRE
jgi:RNA polymerase sigma-70 factor, ECF subfamily